MYNKKFNNTNQFLIYRDDLFCRYCNKKCKNLNSLKQHEIRCKNNPNRINIQNNLKNNRKNNLKNRNWSKGLSAETDERVKRARDKVIEYYKNHHGTMLNKHHSDETKEKLRQIALENHSENHFGSHKSYLYNGVKFISSYEVDVAKSLDENNLKWVKPNRLPYFDLNGNKHHYTADFYLPEYDVYLDPKNDYLINHINRTMGYSDIEKINWVMEQNGVRIFVLNKDTLEWPKIKQLITAGGNE